MIKFLLNRIDKLTSAEKIYIIPTREGLYYLFTNTMIIFIGLVYNNNPILLIGFMLFTLFIVSMIYTNYNLSGINIYAPEFIHGFVDDFQGFKCGLENSSQYDRHALNIDLICKKDIKKLFVSKIEQNSNVIFERPLNITNRGLYQIKRIQFSTSYPFGLFRSWKYFNWETKGIVYPKKAGIGLNEYLKQARDEDEYMGLRYELGEFVEHKKYQDGESLKQIDWKVYAKGQALMSKVYDETHIRTWEFNFNKLNNDSIEERLSQLSKWIDECAQMQQRWKLVLPHIDTQINQGLEFKKSCLEKLAAYTEEFNDK